MFFRASSSDKWYQDLAHTFSLVSVVPEFVKIVKRARLGRVRKKLGSTNLPCALTPPRLGMWPRTPSPCHHLRPIPYE